MHRAGKIPLWQLLKVAVSSLSAHKLRTGLTILGVIISVTTLILVVSVLEGMDNYINERVRNMGANVFILRKMPTRTTFEEWIRAMRRNKDIKMDDLTALAEKARLVKEVGATAADFMTLKYQSQTSYDVVIEGITSAMVNLSGVEIDDGRYLSALDIDQTRNACFIGADVAENLFPRLNPLGKVIRIRGIPFEVVGLAKKAGSSFGESRDNFVNIPLTTFQKHFGSRRTITIWLRAAGAEVMEDAMDEVRVLMRARHHLKYSENDDFGLAKASEALNQLWNNLMGPLAKTSYLVTSVFLIVGGIVIMNIMLAVVTERTREVGIRKSLGARRRDILLQFLIESIAMSVIGGTAGVFFAYLGTKLLSKLADVPAALPIWAVFVSLLVSSAVGLFFGLYPANKAAKLDPIVALRYE